MLFSCSCASRLRQVRKSAPILPHHIGAFFCVGTLDKGRAQSQVLLFWTREVSLVWLYIPFGLIVV